MLEATVVGCKMSHVSLFSSALFIGFYLFMPVQYLNLLTHDRLPFPCSNVIFILRALFSAGKVSPNVPEEDDGHEDLVTGLKTS